MDRFKVVSPRTGDFAGLSSFSSVIFVIAVKDRAARSENLIRIKTGSYFSCAVATVSTVFLEAPPKTATSADEYISGFGVNF